MKKGKDMSGQRTPADEAVIAKAVADYRAKVKEAETDAEIRNRILDEQRKQPGYKYY